MIIVEAVQKASDILAGSDTAVENLEIGLLIMGSSALINFYVSSKLMKVAKQTDSIALEADSLHLRTDVYTSLGVFCGLLLIKITGWLILDPIVAIGVALLIIKASFALTREAFAPLVDVSLPEQELEIINEVLKLHEDEFVEFHKLRTRRAGSERHVDLHLVVAKYTPVVEVHDLCDRIEAEINQKLQGTHILIHVEPCNSLGAECPVEDGGNLRCESCQRSKDQVHSLDSRE